MKGTIVQCLQELVTTHFGKNKWEKVLENAGVKTSAVFLSFQDIDDSLVMRLVTAVCKVNNISLPQAADAFGEYWVTVYCQRMYPHYFKRRKTARDFLLDMDTVHVTITKRIKNAKPPRFDYEWKDEKTLIMHYKSHRGLVDFVVGLAKGVGKFYKEDLRITKLSDDKVQIVFRSSLPTTRP